MGKIIGMGNDITRDAVTRTWNFDETLQRLSQSPFVEGIAEFGSRAAARESAASDYDLLIVLRDMPSPVFQIITAINGRIADIVPADKTVVERIITEGEAAITDRFTLMLVQKLRTARILFDQSGLMGNAQAAAQTIPEKQLLPQPVPYGQRYAEMFWQGFVTQQARRMAQADDEVHHLAADMMITSILTQTYRAYFELRGLVWEGEKAALRYWRQHDLACYELVRALINSVELKARLSVYEALSTHVLAGYGEPIRAGQTAVMFASEVSEGNVKVMLDYWDGLFG